jgi:hypothetical protein
MDKSHRENYWRALIEKWQCGTRGPTEFCKGNKVSTSTFYKYRKLFGCFSKNEANVSSAQPSSNLSLKAVSLIPNTQYDKEANSIIELYFPNGCWVKLEANFNPDSLAKLVKVMETFTYDDTRG